MVLYSPDEAVFVYGGASLVSSMLRHRLIDELFLLANPVAIGPGGSGVFTYLEQPLSLQLKKAESFPPGVTVLHYVL
jgi:dihydrofolate reductase